MRRYLQALGEVITVLVCIAIPAGLITGLALGTAAVTGSDVLGGIVAMIALVCSMAAFVAWSES